MTVARELRGDTEVRADVLVVGAGLGGIAAALSALRRGSTVCLTEEGDWVGGQLTAQALPFDEHPWIERYGCTDSYRRLREAIRAHYRAWYPLRWEARRRRRLNPGEGLVGPLCTEPVAPQTVLRESLAPYEATAQLRLLLSHRPTEVAIEGDTIRSVTVVDEEGRHRLLRAGMVVDATELGDLLALGGIEHVTGSESRSETQEPHASPRARPANMQAISWSFALEYRHGENHRIERPTDYDAWTEYRPTGWPGPSLGLVAPDPRTASRRQYRFDPRSRTDGSRALATDPGDFELWAYRRIRSARLFRSPLRDVSLINWPMNDYTGGPLFGVPDAEAAGNREAARRLSLSLLYWLQTDAPRPDGGTGWPGLRPCGEVVGTSDGFAKAPYVRESRRIRARTTIREQDVALDVRGRMGATRFPDSVGIGMYRIDLHPSTGGDGYVDIASAPFEIPLGALLPVRTRNLIAAAKNIGTTHITNGCYRLHPVEWNIGEAAGALAAHCVNGDRIPAAVHEDERRLEVFRSELARDGVPLRWRADHERAILEVLLRA